MMRRLSVPGLRLAGRLALSTLTFLAGASLPPMFAAREETREAAYYTTPLPASLPPEAVANLSRAIEERGALARPSAQPSPSPSPSVEDEWDSLSRIPPVVVSPERMLVTVGNTLYMMDSRRRAVWHWPDDALAPWPAINDQPLVIGDTIYVVAMDLTHVALDLNTGKEKWHFEGCGHAIFAQLAKYKDDVYLMRIDMTGYDYTDTDSLDAFDLNNNELWSVDFPRGATLQVWGGKIYAVERKGDSVALTEIKPPRNGQRSR